jgi:hypothetical protein
MKPSKKQLERWIAALRSGEYNQCGGTLQNKKGYCCLGVACKVIIPESKLRKVKDSKTNEYLLVGLLPTQQHKAPIWLKSINRKFEKKTSILLSDVNDKLKLTFDEIADLLELVYIHKILD